MVLVNHKDQLFSLQGIKGVGDQGGKWEENKVDEIRMDWLVNYTWVDPREEFSLAPREQSLAIEKRRQRIRRM